MLLILSTWHWYYYCYCYYYNDFTNLVIGELHQPVLLLLKANITPGSPLQPQLEDVIVTATLDHLQEDIHYNNT